MDSNLRVSTRYRDVVTIRTATSLIVQQYVPKPRDDPDIKTTLSFRPGRRDIIHDLSLLIREKCLSVCLM